jgi:hypothetical protein
MKVVETKYLSGVYELNKVRGVRYGEKIDKYGEEIQTYELEDWEYKLLEINKTHPQLGGILILADVVATIRKLGMIIVAPMGQGKSTIIRTLRDGLRGIEVVGIDSGFTPSHLYLRMKEDPEYVEKFKKCVFCIDDLSTFMSHAEESTIASFTMISQLIEAGRYEGYMRMHPTIPEAHIAVVGASTVKVLKDIVKLGIWASHVADRMLRVYFAYYNIKKTDELVDVTFEHPKIEIDYKDGFNEYSIGWNVDSELFKKCVNMLRHQFSERRAINYARRLIKGHAYLSDRDAMDKDAMWLLTYTPFIAIETSFIYSPRVVTYGVDQTGPLIYSDIYPTVLYFCSMYPQDIGELKKNTRLDRSSLEYVLRQLMDAGYITNVGDKYFVGGKYAETLKMFHSTFSGAHTKNEEGGKE